MLVDHAHRVAVQQFAACNRDAELDDLDGGVHRVRQRVKGAGGCHDGFGQRIQLERDFGDHPQRAFAADHEARQVVTSR